MNWKRVALRVLFFALLGLLIEVFFTGVGRIFKGDWDMEGNASPWMMPVYGLLGLFVAPVSDALKRHRISLIPRALLYMMLIFVVEYLFGALFDLVGLEIWNYSRRPLNLHGYITLTYAPFWFFLGLWLEYLHRRIDTCAVALSRGLDPETLLAIEQSITKQEGGRQSKA